MTKEISRRDFLKLGASFMGSKLTPKPFKSLANGEYQGPGSCSQNALKQELAVKTGSADKNMLAGEASASKDEYTTSIEQLESRFGFESNCKDPNTPVDVTRLVEDEKIIYQAPSPSTDGAPQSLPQNPAPKFSPPDGWTERVVENIIDFKQETTVEMKRSARKFGWITSAVLIGGSILSSAAAYLQHKKSMLNSQTNSEQERPRPNATPIRLDIGFDEEDIESRERNRTTPAVHPRYRYILVGKGLNRRYIPLSDFDLTAEDYNEVVEDTMKSAAEVDKDIDPKNFRLI